MHDFYAEAMAAIMDEEEAEDSAVQSWPYGDLVGYFTYPAAFLEGIVSSVRVVDGEENGRKLWWEETHLWMALFGKDDDRMVSRRKKARDKDYTFKLQRHWDLESSVLQHKREVVVCALAVVPMIFQKLEHWTKANQPVKMADKMRNGHRLLRRVDEVISGVVVDLAKMGGNRPAWHSEGVRLELHGYLAERSNDDGPGKLGIPMHSSSLAPLLAGGNRPTWSSGRRC